MKALKESELRYRRLFETAQEGILILNAETGLIEEVNPYLVKMLGYTRTEFIQKKLWDMGTFQDIQASQKAFEDLQAHKYIRYEDLPLKTKHGEIIQVEFISSVYLVGAEKVVQCNIRDITEQKAAQAALMKSEALLREQSVRDHLTGLFNRRYMEETLDRELLRASRKKLSLGLIMMDVDHFKDYNDTLGHAAGDLILRELGYLLLRLVRREDIPCRYGGDEFLIVMPDASQDVTRERASLIGKAAHALALQFEAQPMPVLSLSLGVAIFPRHGVSSTRILRAVDSALYHAKHEGLGRVVVAERISAPIIHP